MGSISGKVVLITGGAAGVGAEVARRLHAKGAKLVLTDLDGARLSDMSAALGADRVLTDVADVRDLSAMQAVVAAAVERFGGVDVVVANAGIASYGSVSQVDPDAFKRVLEVNVVGVFNTVRAALPSIIERRGYVLVVSSLAAYAASPGLAAYNASKAAVEQFANALRLEVTHRGVDVGSAHMSWIDTAMVRDPKDDLSTFGELISKLPGPLKKTTSVEECGKAFVAGIEGRKRQVNCPRWVGAVRWLKPLLATPIGMAPVLKLVPDILPRMDAEVAALGRSSTAHTEALEKPTAQ
jgi:NAD(P)-dependent dehydrogenase (short-subunit alcohol dehydrogenase family)